VSTKILGDCEPDPFLNRGFWLPVCAKAVVTPQKKCEAAINSDRSLFRPWQRDIETSVFIYETIRRAGRVHIPAAPSAAVIIQLEYVPSFSCQRARQQGGRLSLAGAIMAIRRPSVQLIVVIHPINYANGATRLLQRSSTRRVATP
jgi:hypothetical protein